MELLISEQHWAVINKVIEEADKKFGECSWLGIGTREGSNAIVDRILFPEQENSASASDMEEGSLNELTLDLKEGERVIWWGHSHAKMSTFFSGTDWETWNNWVGSDHDVEFFYASVHNAKGEEPYELVHWHGETFETSGILTVEETVDEEVEEAVEAALLNMSKPIPTPYSAYKKPIPGSYQTTMGYDDWEIEYDDSKTGVSTYNAQTGCWNRTSYKNTNAIEDKE